MVSRLQLGINFDLNGHVKRREYQNKLATFQRILEQAPDEEERQSAREYIDKYQRLLDELDKMYRA